MMMYQDKADCCKTLQVMHVYEENQFIRITQHESVQLMTITCSYQMISIE